MSEELTPPYRLVSGSGKHGVIRPDLTFAFIHTSQRAAQRALFLLDRGMPAEKLLSRAGDSISLEELMALQPPTDTSGTSTDADSINDIATTRTFLNGLGITFKEEASSPYDVRDATHVGNQAVTSLRVSSYDSAHVAAPAGASFNASFNFDKEGKFTYLFISD